MVPYSTYLTLYDNDGNSGTAFSVDGAELHSGPNIEMKCYDIVSQFNNKTTSLSVIQKNGGQAIGEWRSVGTATGSYKVSF